MTEKQEGILIVDDEESIRRLLNQKLSGEGYQCQEAGNAEQALEVLTKSSIALVLLDIKMQGKLGTELLPEIKAKYPETAVIMATAIADTRVAIQCMKQGAYDYLIKPFDLDDVLLSVSRALEKRRLEFEREALIKELQEALANIKTLSGLLPICAWCKKIRDDKEYWEDVEAYISAHTQAEFTHSICPDCEKKYFPEVNQSMETP